MNRTLISGQVLISLAWSSMPAALASPLNRHGGCCPLAPFQYQRDPTESPVQVPTSRRAAKGLIRPFGFLPLRGSHPPAAASNGNGGHKASVAWPGLTCR